MKPGRNRKLLKINVSWKACVAVWTWVSSRNVVGVRGREERGKSSRESGTTADMVAGMSVVDGEGANWGVWRVKPGFSVIGHSGKIRLIEAEGTCRTDGGHWKGRTTILRKCAQRGKEADRRRMEWCWLGDITLMQNTSIILQTCSLTLVLGSTCILGSGSWGPSLLGSSLTSLWDTSLMWLPTAARLNFKTQQVFFWSCSQSCSPISFEHFLAVCLIVTSSLTPFELSRTRLLLCFWGYFLSFQNHKHLQTKYEKLTEIRKLCQTWLEKTSIS